VKIAFWAIVVILAGYAVISGLNSFVFGRGGTVCTSSTEGWKDCEWDLGAVAFSGFFLILFALLLFFSSRSLIQAVRRANVVWHTDTIIWQTALVIGVIAALVSIGQLLSQLVGEGVCFAPNPNGSIWMDGGRFEYAECEGSAWWESMLPLIALIASLGVAAVSFLRLRDGQRSVGP